MKTSIKSGVHQIKRVTAIKVQIIPTDPKKLQNSFVIRGAYKLFGLGKLIGLHKMSRVQTLDLVGLVAPPLIAFFCTIYKRPKRPQNLT